jgi:hypothetical protein
VVVMTLGCGVGSLLTILMSHHEFASTALCLQPYNSQNMDRVNIFLNIGHNIDQTPFLSIPEQDIGRTRRGWSG